MARLIPMKKDDSALTPREESAVVVARELTRQPIVSYCSSSQPVSTWTG